MNVAAFVSEQGLPYLLSSPPYPRRPESEVLIVFLHGAGERVRPGVVSAAQAGWCVLRGFNHESRSWTENYARCTPMGLAADSSFLVDGCVVLAPATHKRWGMESERVLALIVSVMARTPSIDPRRVVLTGLSMGGAGVFEIASQHPELFAGISPICGTAPHDVSALAHTPAWVAHGTRDAIIPVGQSILAVKALRAAGNSRVVFDTFPADHDSWSATYSDPSWWAWAKARKRGVPPDAETIRITYRSSWSPAFLVFRADRGAWACRIPTGAADVATELDECMARPFVPSPGGASATGALLGEWQSITVRASTMTFCATDGRGGWDNPPGGGNYEIREPGVYIWDSGKVTAVHAS
jgi:dienelactone hydrolase